MTAKFYTFIIGAYGNDSEDAYENLYDENLYDDEYEDISLGGIMRSEGGRAFETAEEADKHYSIVDAVPEVKSVPMAEIKAIQEELHEIVWGDTSRLWDNASLKAILGKLQMLTDQ